VANSEQGYLRSASVFLQKSGAPMGADGPLGGLLGSPEDDLLLSKSVGQLAQPCPLKKHRILGSAATLPVGQ